ncbi:MAG: hypothetical protein LBT26_09220 [Clostridiales Family XIII bacterium]|nr:hypothetical protein [Clostridiales Family XIII bacterium]
MYKKNLTPILIAALLFMSAPALSASGAGTDALRFTNCPAENFTLSLDGGTLRFAGLPDSKVFSELLVCIVNKNNVVLEELLHPAGGSASLRLDNLRDGDYFIEFYRPSLTAANSYDSYVFGDDIQMRWRNGQGVLAESPALPHNRAVYGSKRTDEKALLYYLLPEIDIQSTDAEIVRLSQEITRGIADGYGKVLAVHDWVAANIWYDDDVLLGIAPRGPNDALDTLKTRRGVCDGFSSLTAALLRAAGIPAKFVCGYSFSAGAPKDWTAARIDATEMNHSWNEAFVDGRWLIIDTTWDSGNLYENGRNTASDGLRWYRYFDATLEAFSLDHSIQAYSEAAVDASPESTSAPVTRPASVFGGAVVLDGNPVKMKAFNIEGNNYFQLRDVAQALNGSSKQFSVTWDGARGVIDLVRGAAYLPDGGVQPGGGSARQASAASVRILLDGNGVSMTGYNIDGNNYFKLRDLGKIFDFGIFWDAAANTIRIDTRAAYSPAE